MAAPRPTEKVGISDVGWGESAKWVDVGDGIPTQIKWVGTCVTHIVAYVGWDSVTHISHIVAYVGWDPVTHIWGDVG